MHPSSLRGRAGPGTDGSFASVAMRPPGSPWYRHAGESALHERDHRGGDHPIPFRTRQLSSPSSMILRILTWESRTTPRLYFQKPFRFARKGFCFAQNSAQRPCDEPLLNPRTSLLSLKKAPPLLKCSPLANPLPLAFFNQTGIPLPLPCSGLSLAFLRDEITTYYDRAFFY